MVAGCFLRHHDNSITYSSTTTCTSTGSNSLRDSETDTYITISYAARTDCDSSTIYPVYYTPSFLKQLKARENHDYAVGLPVEWNHGEQKDKEYSKEIRSFKRERSPPCLLKKCEKL
jgi:hypothetical protein